MDDNEIIALFESRSEDAIAELDSKYGRLCRKLARDITHSDEDGEECVSDAMLAVWNKIPPEKPNPLIAYLLRIVRNLAIKKFRSSHTKKRDGGEVLCIDELCEVLTFNENEFDEAELSAIIDRFLTSLSRTDRVIFMRRYWFGESVRAIADGFGMSESAVKVKLFRTRDRMKAYLNKEGIDV